jgi:hypothetical protein
MDNWKLLVLVIIAPPVIIIGAIHIADTLVRKGRFSLRALLVTMTVAALILGWIAYAAKN